MSVLAALAGGLLGTVVLTTVLRTATELHLTRIDLPFLMGTALSGDRTAAKAMGYVAHFLMGLVFALGHAAVLVALGHPVWWMGSVLGLLHGLFAGTVLINVLLPLVHPRMGSSLSDATTVALLEAPGFMGRNYGPQTGVVTLLAHILYGTIVAAAVAVPA